MRDLNALSLPDLFAALTADGWLNNFIERAFEEDWGAGGDITTSSIITDDSTARARLVARQPGICAGLPVAQAMARSFEPHLEARLDAEDGGRCSRGDVLAIIEGSLPALLAMERTMLNIIGRLSGIATLTGRFVEAIEGTGAVICDTRKTTPCMRPLEKYAVRCGGGTMHRMGLHDAVLYKDNHLAGIAPGELAARLAAAARFARAHGHPDFVEVEVTSLEQFQQVLTIEPPLIDIVLLDNMPLDMMSQAAGMRRAASSPIKLEASGGVTLENVRAIAATGIERISVGAITHSAPCLDLALDVEA
jgi:nicotinate-nucleotide pyrophosphorylase (carboxylating)